MPQNTPAVEQTVRFLRIFHGTLLVFIVLCFCILRTMPGQAGAPIDSPLLPCIAVVAVLEAAIAVFIRGKKLGLAFETLRNDPADVKALAQWRQAVIISDALALSVVLYGFVLHLLGYPDRQGIPFFAGGALLMIVWWPRQP